MVNFINFIYWTLALIVGWTGGLMIIQGYSFIPFLVGLFVIMVAQFKCHKCIRETEAKCHSKEN